MKGFNPAKAALSSRFVFLAFQVVFIKTGTKYDSSSVHQSLLSRSSIHEKLSKNVTELHFSDKETWIDSFLLMSLDGFGNWDSVYFLHISEYGYDYEQFMAFFPLFPLCLSVIAKIMHLITFGTLSSIASLYFASCLVNISAFTMAALFLHMLTRKLTKDPKFADVVVLLFCLNPANVFNMAAYTESLYVCLQFMGMYALESNDSAYRYIKAGFLFALGAATRSNGIVSVGFLASMFICDMFNLIFTSKKDNSVLEIKRNIDFTRLMKLLMASLIGIIAPFLSFVSFQLYGYATYCNDSAKTYIYKNHWCQNSIPLSYNYIQSFYWNVGPFRYYEIKQIPNFILACPTILLSYSAVRSYFADKGFTAKVLEYLIYEENFRKRHTIQIGAKLYQSPRMLPFVCHLSFLVIFGLVNIHVQVLTRMVFSSTPLIYWFGAGIILNADAKKFTVLSKPGMLLGFFISYTLLGLLLHCNFYPWT